MRVFKTAASAIALCAILSACGDFPKPQYPVSRPLAPEPQLAPAPQPEAPAAAAPAVQDDAPQARPTTGIQQQTLPPPAGAKASPQRPGAALDMRSHGEVRLMLAAYSPGDEALVYPAARHHHHRKAVAAAVAEDAGDTATVKKGDTLATIAKAHGTTVEDLAKLNGLTSPYRLTAGATIKLPVKAPVAKAEAASPQSATVGKGDTLASIAKAHGTTIEDLAKLNGLKPPYRLTAGASIKLPGAAQEAALAKGKAPAGDEASDEAETVTVGKGDTLATIARTTGVSIQDLARINHLKKPYRLRLGQQIQTTEASSSQEQKPAPAKPAPGKSAKAKTAPEADAAAGAEGATSTITVRRRDTIQSLAKQAKVPVAELARLNHLKKPYRLKPGQKIKLPDQAGAGSDALGREIAASAPKHATSVIAGRHDTLKSIARRAGVSVRELAKLNGLKKPYHLKRGERIKLPARPEAEAPEAGAAPARYKIQGGDTLYSIARRFGTDTKTLADLNGMDVSQPLQAGRYIRLPGGAEDKVAPRAPRTEARPSAPEPYAAAPANPPAANGPPPAAEPAAPSSTPPSSTPASSTPPASSAPPGAAGALTPYRPSAPAPEPTSPADADIAAAGKGLFQWPVRGQTLQAFGPLAGGQRNDGVDIGAAQGDPVRAAAAGEVVYAGNSVPGFGNLVLIRHEGGWVTAYAHLANLDVKMRQTVAQGQQIGEVGQTGGVSQPQLHFEVRYSPTAKDKARPIDPALVLPQ